MFEDEALEILAVDSAGELVGGVFAEGNICSRDGASLIWDCSPLPSLFNKNDVNTNHNWTFKYGMMSYRALYPIENSAVGRFAFSFTETVSPDGYYPDPTPKIAYTGCDGWFTIPGDNGSNFPDIFNEITSCDQVEMLPNNTLTWVKQAIPKATIEPVTSSTSTAPRLSIKNTAVGSVKYRLLVKNSAGEVVNANQPEITLAAGETLDLNLTSLNLPTGDYTYQLMSTDNTDQPIEVTAGEFTVQAQAAAPAPGVSTTSASPMTPVSSAAPNTGVGSQIHPALIIVGSIMALSGAGLAVRGRVG